MDGDVGELMIKELWDEEYKAQNGKIYRLVIYTDSRTPELTTVEAFDGQKPAILELAPGIRQRESHSVADEVGQSFAEKYNMAALLHLIDDLKARLDQFGT
jgi:hypothetical protein